MDQNKYYTPEPSELYEGYELESQTMRGFIKGTFPELIEQDSELDQYNQWGLYMKVAHCVLRTKYLDEDDAKDLGWSFSWQISEDSGESGQCVKPGYELYHPDSREDLEKWYVLEPLEEHTIKITFKYYTNSVSQTWKTLFEGECKSKNELRTIMKFLGICKKD